MKKYFTWYSILPDCLELCSCIAFDLYLRSNVTLSFSQMLKDNDASVLGSQALLMKRKE